RHHNLGQVASLVTVGNLHGFIQLAFAKRTGNGRSERTRLLARRIVRHEAVDHDADRVRRHDEEEDNDPLGQISHLSPEVNRIPLDGGPFLQQIEGPYLQVQKHCYFVLLRVEFLFLNYYPAAGKVRRGTTGST